MRSAIMKKITNILLFATIFAFMSSCENVNNDEVCLNYRVNVEYKDGIAKKILDRDINFDGYNIFNLKGDKLKTSNIVGGDIVDVYVSKNDHDKINRIVIDEADLLILSLHHEVIPGSDGIVDLFVEIPKVIIDQSRPTYVISKDMSYKTLDEWHATNDESKLYGTYRKEEITLNNVNQYEVKMYHLIALYDFNPKAE